MLMNTIFILSDVEKIVYGGKKIALSELPMDKVAECYDFLEKFSADKIIYGINTGFGPMAQWRIDDADRTALQYNIIRSHSTGAGEPLPEECVKAAMVARHGSVGASGDLVQ